MNWKTTLAAGAAIIIGLSVWFEMTSATQVTTITAIRAPIRAFVSEKGRTALPRTHRIAMPLGGRIRPIALQAGDVVDKDQIIAQMDTQDLESELAEANAAVAGIEARIHADKLRAIEDLLIEEHGSWMDAVKQVVSASHEKERASEAQLEYAQWWLDSQEETFKTNVSSAQTLRAARTSKATADVSLTSDKLVTRALLAVETAMRMFPSYVKEYLNLKQASRVELSEQLVSAKVRSERAERDYERATLLSPIDGTVLRRFVDNETFLAAGTALLDIGDLTQLEISAEVLTRDAMRVEAGQVVEVEGLTGETLFGKVERVRPSAFTKLSSLGVEQQRVVVIIAVENEEITALRARGFPIGVGYRVRCRIVIGETEDALVIPRRALIRAPDKHWQVFVVRDDRASLVDVELGLANDDEVEVVEGLEAGSVIVLSPPRGLEDGARVSSE